MKCGPAALLISVFAVCACEPGPAPLISASMIEGDTLPAPLTTIAGDPENGRTVFIERERGHCVICHVLDTVDAPFQGNVGPALSGLGDRLSPAQIRLRIADPALIWPDTLMPSYYKTDGLHQVGADYIGETILSAQEIEDLVAFLSQQRAEEDEDER